jgi:hypothetical protein
MQLFLAQRFVLKIRGVHQPLRFGKGGFIMRFITDATEKGMIVGNGALSSFLPLVCITAQIIMQ